MISCNYDLILGSLPIQVLCKLQAAETMQLYPRIGSSQV